MEGTSDRSERQTRQQVFISYAREDASEIADHLTTTLESNGFKAWNDKQMKPGIPFGRMLEMAINQSFAMLAIISRSALDSHWVRCEWCYAISKGYIDIIPIVIPDFNEQDFPLELFTFSRIKLTEPDDQHSLEHILALLQFARDVPPVWRNTSI